MAKSQIGLPDNMSADDAYVAGVHDGRAQALDEVLTEALNAFLELTPEERATLSRLEDKFSLRGFVTAVRARS